MININQKPIHMRKLLLIAAALVMTAAYSYGQSETSMAPILEELKEECTDFFEVEFIDVWENPKAGEQYGIRMIPTQVFFDAEGKELFRHEGFFEKDAILAKWKEFGI